MTYKLLCFRYDTVFGPYELMHIKDNIGDKKNLSINANLDKYFNDKYPKNDYKYIATNVTCLL